jgi:hypothetical protein
MNSVNGHPTSYLLEVAKRYVDEDENGKKIVASHWDGGEAASWNVNYRHVTAIIKLLINQKASSGARAVINKQ